MQAGIPFGIRFIGQIKPQACFGFVRAMTQQTVLAQQRLNIAAEHGEIFGSQRGAERDDAQDDCVCDEMESAENLHRNIRWLFNEKLLRAKPVSRMFGPRRDS